MPAEARAHFTNKMEAVARLAGGVAHQFNNLLTSILATADLALEAKDLDPSVRSDLEDIREAGQRAAAFTRQLLAFSGTQSLTVRPTNVGDLLSQLEPLLKHLLPPNVTLELQVRSLGTVDTDPVRLEQVILNLVANAADALSQGGTITITAEDVDEIPATDSTAGATGFFTKIAIVDNGLGMDEYVRGRVFEPFLSTKGVTGGGIGLGLATVYGTMKQLGGGVTIESSLGEGTRVELFLGRSLRQSKAVAAPPRPDQGLVPSEAVLVVEDEAIVRAPICRMLRKQGYFVLEANNGEDALLVMEQYHSPIHLIITDVRMPEMDGPALVGLLRDWYPRMRVLFISGYSTEYLEAQSGKVHGTAFLAKPFSLDTLARRVRDVLDVEWGMGNGEGGKGQHHSPFPA
jgi:two-component system cell cycle sensor histidine kinase/response regulator CckA